ncbi:hypothetical protein [Streptacidiphilus carbonis]|uniref:hypothetical protein n=1 Tax=Streptacidiphilus carbonis TaxID=105422 RepID=UPI0005AA4072|nr:hypothetical protein [Streptacidiphilus carbonis]
MSVIGKDEGIEHGTTKGYAQHTYRKVPATEACGCLKAVRDARAAKTKQAAAKNGTKAGKRSFVQHDGIPQAPRAVRSPAGCPEPDCGQEADTDIYAGAVPLPRGWVQVKVSGSTEPARSYCSGSCAAFGVALAELRMAVSA